MHISLSLCVCVYVCTGRLCILDWGMVIRVPQDLQLSLLEFIANLSAENYEEVPNDLVKLSFVPADKIDELRASGKNK